MPIRLGETPQASFDQPLALLSDCHRRIERFLHILVRVTTERRGGLLDPQYRAAVETALHYFREAAPRHTQDEEESLFPRLVPRLRASRDPRAAEALAHLARLEKDHEVATQLHAHVERVMQRWLAASALKLDEEDQLERALRRLEALYVEHIRIEDRWLFPLAAKLLEPEELKAVGAEMARRRGLAPPG